MKSKGSLRHARILKQSSSMIGQEPIVRFKWIPESPAKAEELERIMGQFRDRGADVDIDRHVGFFGVGEPALIIIGLMALSEFIQTLSNVFKDHKEGGGIYDSRVTPSELKPSKSIPYGRVLYIGIDGSQEMVNVLRPDERTRFAELIAGGGVKARNDVKLGSTKRRKRNSRARKP